MRPNTSINRQVKNPIVEVPLAKLDSLSLIETSRYDYHVKLLFQISKRRIRSSGDQLFIELRPDVADLEEFLDKLRGLAGIEKHSNPEITNREVIQSFARQVKIAAAQLEEVIR